jgi:hybrid cluster-associated redox disulfide protein
MKTQSDVKEKTKQNAHLKAKNKVSKDTNLASLLSEYPETAEILLDYGLHCVGCFANSFDTVEAGAKIHGFTNEEVDEMIDRLNEVIEFGE